MKQKCLLSLAVAFLLAQNSFSASDMSLGVAPPNAYVLSKGVLQVGAYANYANLDLAKALGTEIDANTSKGVGEYFEKGGHIWFGLTSRLTASFQFSSTDFSYADKKAEVSYQELRLKRGLVVNSPRWGFWSLEGAWRRHSTNNLSVAGVEHSRSNILHDYGWGTRLLASKNILGMDWHGHVGFNHYDEDGDKGQDVWETGVGMSKFWGHRYQWDIFYHLYGINRNSPQYSSKSSDKNSTVSMGFAYHITELWSMELRGQLNDNLFRGYWPFMDREVDTLNFSRYGYLTLGFTYRTNYSM